MEQTKETKTNVSERPLSFETTRSHDTKDGETKSDLSTSRSIDDAELGKIEVQINQKERRNPLARLWSNVRVRKTKHTKPPTTGKRRCWRYVAIIFVVLGVFGAIAAVIYISFVGALIRRLGPPEGHSGLDAIVKSWKEPNQNGAYQYTWRDDFSRDVVPKNCHSHNDYWRSVPLYAALAAGCTSVEADIWLSEDQELLVGHTWSSTTPHRTLRNLYLDPLSTIFEHRNVTPASEPNKETGLFDSDPSTTTVLLIDMKSSGQKLWPILLSQLQPLHDRKWLTYYDGQTLNPGPLTIVGTGQTPFDLIQQNSSNRFIFYDAPLVSVSQPQFNTSNSYYASANFKAAISDLWLGKWSAKQEKQVRKQIEAAEEKGLKSRYYDTPAWPVGLRDSVWKKLMDFGVGVLNVDDVVSAGRWNWGFCIVAGFVLCGR